MFMIGIISEPLLYLCFSLLLGRFILRLVPSTYRPDFNVPKGVLMLATAGIAIFSFIPVLQVILYLYQDIGFKQTLKSVLFTFEVGKAWIFTCFLSNLLFIYIVWFDYRKNQLYAYIGIVITFILILALGWSSHASSIERWKGFLVHTIHFLAVTIWVGILFVVSWASKSHLNWMKFLKWFTPVALICFLITVISGLFLMTVVIDYKDYANSWILPYGQALLIKHLLIAPLLAYVLINSILIRKKLKNNDNYNPRPWTKAESLIVFLIFSATAALGQQEPPHDIETTIAASGVSRLFDLLYQGNITGNLVIVFGFEFNSVMLLLLALSFLGLTILSYVKRAPILLGFSMSVLFVVATYLSLMVSIR
ncbi:CopD family protein [Bacillus sp. ISL-4]|uniref:copper resistance D family protein n=1 Tax=Bacillus sp. ISL-4 TaxID=2819125 RepID=UPI001BE5120E|nr:CopD family protein [Bacillus sp. ISL-4]MBT2669157.1 CopD family protein [Bacillus sp. ISL-4]MBT2674359.1 CopD family protein [Streptomyces sp. ISL-14]